MAEEIADAYQVLDNGHIVLEGATAAQSFHIERKQVGMKLTKPPKRRIQP
ncbi:MAG: hypothetical protein OXF07_12490 [Rhodobacter sp.]|nr:hypothetical protein [Rhodobacter sp.]MCY4167475.1 hypothetical protein [Rhodobacter sp.]